MTLQYVIQSAGGNKPNDNKFKCVLIGGETIHKMSPIKY